MTFDDDVTSEAQAMVKIRRLFAEYLTVSSKAQFQEVNMQSLALVVIATAMLDEITEDSA